MLDLKARFQEILRERLAGHYPLSSEDIDLIYPPQQNMGDLALSFPFQLAKKTKANPRQIAQEIMARLGTASRRRGDGRRRRRLHQLFSRQSRHSSRSGSGPSATPRSVPKRKRSSSSIRTSIRTRRPTSAICGTPVLGDTLVRCLRYKGEKVEVQNYIDDTGVQVVDVVFGFMELEVKIARRPRNDRTVRLLLLGPLRPHGGLPRRPSRIPAAQSRDPQKNRARTKPRIAMAYYVSRRILRAHLATMRRIGAAYDVLPCESSILGLKFWEKPSPCSRRREASSLRRGRDRTRNAG